MHVVRFTEEGRYGQPKYSYEKAIYVVIISFALDFFFGSIGFNFLLRMGLHSARFAGEDALLNRRKSGTDKKYLCKLENTDKSIFLQCEAQF